MLINVTAILFIIITIFVYFRLLSLAFSSNNLVKWERCINYHNEEIASQMYTDQAHGLSGIPLHIAPKASSTSSLQFSGSAKHKVQVSQYANTVVCTDRLVRILQYARGFTTVLTRSILYNEETYDQRS